MVNNNKDKHSNTNDEFCTLKMNFFKVKNHDVAQTTL